MSALCLCSLSSTTNSTSLFGAVGFNQSSIYNSLNVLRAYRHSPPSLASERKSASSDMPTAQALNRKLHSTVAPTATTKAQPSKSADVTDEQENKLVRLHITPFNPVLLKAYLAPSVLPLAQNISYHSVETFPEKGFGYLELPTMEATKLKKKLNGSILKGSKIRIEDAKPEKRKALVNGEAAEEEKEERPSKRAKKQKKEQGVLEGIELPDGRKVKRGWTEPPTKHKKDKADKKDKKDNKEKKPRQKESKYTKEPELLFKAHLKPAAANALEASSKDKKKKEKKDKKRSKREVIVHEFENNTKHASFLKTPKISNEKKPAVEYVNGKGWVDEDGVVVEPETGKARNRRLLELVDTVPIEHPPKPEAVPAPTSESKPSATPEVEPSKSKAKSKGPEKPKKKKVTPPPSDSESSAEESSVVSSSESSDESDNESESESDASSTKSTALTAPQTIITPSSPEEKKEVHPLEVLFKRPKDSPSATNSTPSRLAPIKTSFSFFGDSTADGDVEDGNNPPVTPFTKQDLEWRGLRSAAPTPDTAAIGRRFSFPWRTGSHESADDGEEDITEADKELTSNTKANAVPATINEEDEEEEHSDKDVDMDEDEAQASDVDAGSFPIAGKDKEGKGEKQESEFEKWFWENRGDNNRAWKKRKREGLKVQRLRENRKISSVRRG